MLIYKALHIIAMVAWFAGLFYLPRLFVYHSDAKDTISQERFKIMERRLFYGIMNPAAVATVIFGLVLIYYNLSYYMLVSWMHYKFLLVILLLVYHASCGYFVRQFKLNKNSKSSKFYRIYNELPTLLLIGIVMLVVVKPS